MLRGAREHKAIQGPEYPALRAPAFGELVCGQVCPEVSVCGLCLK